MKSAEYMVNLLKLQSFTILATQEPEDVQLTVS